MSIAATRYRLYDVDYDVTFIVMDRKQIYKVLNEKASKMRISEGPGGCNMTQL